MSPIPIQNVYYLLCYVWNALEQGATVDVAQDDCRSMKELFGRVLEAGATHLLKRGLDRQYVTEAVDTPRPRGKLDVSETVKRNLPVRSRVHCHVDSLSHDVLHNRLLKSTIGRVVRCENVDRELRDRLLRVYRRLHDVSEVPITSSAFTRVVLHRNNAHYRLPIEVCRLIHDNRLIEAFAGRSRFRDFLREERAMARLFEKFVFNFYSREQDEYRVGVERFGWQAVTASEDDLALLPGMYTDVSLESPGRKIVLDTKFYRTTFQTTQAGREKVRSDNLYQLYAYLRNVEIRDGRRPEGVLLYPTVDHHLHLDYDIHGYRIRVVTLNLDQDWRKIHADLLALLA